MKPFQGVLGLVIFLSAGTPALAGNKIYDFTYFLNQPHPFAIQAPAPLPAAAPATPGAVAPAPTPRYATGAEVPPAPQPSGQPAGDDERWLGGVYLTVNAIGGRSFMSDHEYTGGSGLVVRRDVDWVAGNSGALGYSWEEFGYPVRSELELGLRYRFDLDYRGTVGGIVRGYTNELATFFAMLNGYYDFELEDWNWTPYLGAGVGAARHWTQSERKNFGGATAADSQDQRTNAFSWALMGGATYNWNRNWAAKIEGRYWDLGDVTSGPFASNDKITGHYTTYDLVLGITYYP